MKRILGLAVLALAGCHAVNHADAITLLDAVDRIAQADVSDPDQQARFLMQACAEVPFCALGCKASFIAAGSAPDADATALIAKCSADYRAASPQPAPGVWFRGYLKGRLDASRKELSDIEKIRLDNACARIEGLH
jgi:hypothetical protein